VNKYLRVIITLALVLGIAALAKEKVAWADPDAEVDTSAFTQNDASVLLDKPEPGTVKPPRPKIKFCEVGLHSVGGVATINVLNLKDGYCLEAFLHNKAFALGRIPDGAGKVLANVTFLQVYYQGDFTYEVPAEDGSIEICFANPYEDANIYFFDFYGPRFGERTGQPSWELLQTTTVDGLACAPAQTSGAYALIGK